MEARKWALILSFIAVSLVLVGLLVPQPASLEGLSVSSPLFWLSISLLALADSVNPCMISAMILMVATLVALGLERRSVVVRAALFTLTVFTTYLLLGVLLFYGYSYIYALSVAIGGFNVLKALLVLALLVGGLLNVRDALRGGKATLAIPESAKEKIKSLITYVSITATLLLAVFVTIVELPCTGIFYMGLIAYMHSVSENVFAILPVLAYYNVLFVVPETAITLFVWKGWDPSTLSGLYKKHRRAMRLLQGIIMIALAAIVWFLVRVG